MSNLPATGVVVFAWVYVSSYPLCRAGDNNISFEIGKEDLFYGLIIITCYFEVFSHLFSLTAHNSKTKWLRIFHTIYKFKTHGKVVLFLTRHSHLVLNGFESIHVFKNYVSQNIVLKTYLPPPCTIRSFPAGFMSFTLLYDEIKAEQCLEQWCIISKSPDIMDTNFNKNDDSLTKIFLWSVSVINCKSVTIPGWTQLNRPMSTACMIITLAVSKQWIMLNNI